MFIGFLTGGQLGDLKKTLEWAEEKGFKAISISTGPSNEFFNVNAIISDPKETKELLKNSKVIVSAIGFYGNPIHKEESTRKVHQKFFLDLIEVAYRLEIPVVTGWVGLYPGSVEDNIKEIKNVWPEIIKKAEDRNIKIAIENCPGNIAYRPDIWEKMFEVIPSKNFGLEFDPSHLICQMIDAVSVADEFGDRIHHTHVKDAQVLWEKVSRNGIRSEGWCPHRLPGYGDLNWADFITVLKKHGYNYALSIEHEDPYFKYEEGLLLAKKFLEQFVV
ncbi:MAG: sugar phosphate isomerase/epimerase [Thermoproteota archaeon]|nr:sugar phosphate isomerase/epimerase [Candidatus Brockarchaeota archaeon]